MNPRDYRSQIASTEPGAMGIPYKSLGLITLVGKTHDTSVYPCNWQPGASGRSYIPFQPCMRRGYCAPPGRHDVPRHDGRHITPAVAACIGLDEATSNTPSLLHHQPVKQRSVLTSLLHLVTLLHPRTPLSPYDIAGSPL